jgi:Pvc16 N-terminal domain
MSNALAISGVSYVLQYYLINLYTTAFSGNPPKVTCLAPDQVQNSLGDISAPSNQVNLFLHQVKHNAAWRNAELPSLGADGATRLSSPPLALDLHYLLTVYGSDDWQSEALLGYAVLLLHENPVLTRLDITTALGKATAMFPLNPLSPDLDGCGLADQIEMLKITPDILGREEMAWLWTALKADYRLTYPFQVTVALLQPQRSTSLGLPVLHRRITATAVQPAQILEVKPPNGQVAAASTDVVTVTGEFLAGVSRVALTNARTGSSYTVAVTNATPTSFTFVPNQSLAQPAGAYSLVAQFLDPLNASLVAQVTSPVPFSLAPTLATQTATVTANPAGTLVTIDVSPNLVEGQDVALVLSSITPPPPGTALFTCSAPAQPISGSTGSVTFQFPALTAGALLGRLLVDGVTSQVQVDLAAHPPVFQGPFVTV